jgi:spermidine synthase
MTVIAPEDAPVAGPVSTGLRPGRGRLLVLLALFFVSGFAALAYQVLWVRELGLLFGSTAQAAALAIAIFFAGIATGGWFWGRRAAGVGSSLRTFGRLEVGVAATALGHFVLVDAYHAVYPALFATVGHLPALDTGLKALVAAVILLPPAFLMGGTLPAMGQHLVAARDRLATTGTALYAVNTAGSAAGALAAGFVLPLVLGFDGAYLLAVGLDLSVGIAAISLAARWPAGHPVTATTPRDPAPAPRPPDERPAPGDARSPRLPSGLIWGIAFASGLATLGVEVIFTRLFAQVLQNSAYTYALVLTTFLLALALGAGIAHGLARLPRPRPQVLLAGLLVAGGAVTACIPWLFHAGTDGLAYVGGDADWGSYVLAVAGLATVVMLLPAVVLGTTLPYLLRVLQAGDRQPGDTIGRLVAANTLGAIAGSLTAGFVLLPTVGAWRGLLLLAAIYPVLLCALLLRHPTPARLAAVGLAAVAGGTLLAVDPQGLATVRFSTQDDERVREVVEGPAATAAVLERDGERLLRVNNYYTLGSTRGADSERNQAVIPMLTHPAPESVFFLGMGTGITAGASLSFDVEQVVVCEILPEVVALADRHFRPWVGGLFTDERVTIHAEDGRTCLRRSDERYDLIISDLFTPWKAGTGNLYTLEHYESARQRLRPGGRVVQWIPLYQVSERELGIIARTMDEAFEQVTLWRGDLFPNRSIVALVGQADGEVLDPEALSAQGRVLRDDPGLADEAYEALVLRHYAGNITASGLFDGYPINTDAHPRIEYLAPRTHREVRSGEGEFLVGDARDRVLGELREAVPTSEDPHLARLSSRQRDHVDAGWHRQRSALLSDQGQQQRAEEELTAFERLTPSQPVEELSPARWLLGR